MSLQVSHKKTLFYIEQLLLKHQVHLSALRVKGNRHGLDFFFAHKQEAVKLVEFLVAAIPCHSKASQELVSHDIHNNTYNYKHTFSVEIVPICKVYKEVCVVMETLEPVNMGTYIIQTLKVPDTYIHTTGWSQA